MLTKGDDYPIHQTPAPIAQPVSADPNHYDRYWFNGYDRDASFFLGGAMGHYPNRGVIDGALSVVHDGVEHSVFASGRMPDDRATRIGPLRIDIVEPLRVVRYVVAENDHGLAADVTFRARTAPIEEPRQQIVRNNVPMMDYTRLTQWGTWEGTITLPTGVTLELDPSRTYATRDRSWGVRGVGQQAPTNFEPAPMQIFWLWAPLHFDDCCTHLALFERADGERWLEQALIVPVLPDDSDPEHLARSEYRVEWLPGRREMAWAELTLRRRDGTALPTIRLGMKLYLLTMVRKSELQDAVWDEVDFENAVWTIPKERMKRSKPHNVYLCRQTLDIMIALKTCAGNSRYLLPSRYDADAPMSRATFNRVTYAVVERAQKEGLPLEPFTVHDLRRTGSTLLNELGFNSDWIEKCLAHEDGRSSRGVYNKAEYEHQRRHMMQEWSDIVDAWVAGQKRVPVLVPPAMPMLAPDPAL